MSPGTENETLVNSSAFLVFFLWYWPILASVSLTSQFLYELILGTKISICTRSINWLFTKPLFLRSCNFYDICCFNRSTTLTIKATVNQNPISIHRHVHLTRLPRIFYFHHVPFQVIKSLIVVFILNKRRSLTDHTAPLYAVGWVRTEKPLLFSVFSSSSSSSCRFVIAR